MATKNCKLEKRKQSPDPEKAAPGFSVALLRDAELFDWDVEDKYCASIANYSCISENLRHRLCRCCRPRQCSRWAAEDPMNLVDRHLSPPIYGPCVLARMNLWTKTCRLASFGAELSTVNMKITFKYNDPIRAYIRFCASVLAPTHLRPLRERHSIVVDLYNIYIVNANIEKVLDRATDLSIIVGQLAKLKKGNNGKDAIMA
jgi:hypothetical protein